MVYWEKSWFVNIFFKTSTRYLKFMFITQLFRFLGYFSFLTIVCPNCALVPLIEYWYSFVLKSLLTNVVLWSVHSGCYWRLEVWRHILFTDCSKMSISLLPEMPESSWQLKYTTMSFFPVFTGIRSKLPRKADFADTSLKSNI